MLLTFIKLPFVIKVFVLSIFEWRFYTGFSISQYLADIQHFTQVLLYLNIEPVSRIRYKLACACSEESHQPDQSLSLHA